jgi:hypothetical protein
VAEAVLMDEAQTLREAGDACLVSQEGERHEKKKQRKKNICANTASFREGQDGCLGTGHAASPHQEREERHASGHQRRACG